MPGSDPMPVSAVRPSRTERNHMNRRLITAAISLVAVTGLAVSGCSSKASQNKGGGGTAKQSAVAANAPKLTIMVGGLSKQIYLPFMLTKELGYYAKAGVNVNLI